MFSRLCRNCKGEALVRVKMENGCVTVTFCPFCNGHGCGWPLTILMWAMIYSVITILFMGAAFLMLAR